MSDLGLGAASLGIQVFKDIYKFCNDFSGAEKETQVLAECNNDCRVVFERVQDLVANNTTLSNEDRALMNGLAKRATNMLAGIHKKLEKMRMMGGHTASPSNIARRIRWIASKDDVLEMAKRLDAAKTTFLTMLQVIQLLVSPFFHFICCSVVEWGSDYSQRRQPEHDKSHDGRYTDGPSRHLRFPENVEQYSPRDIWSPCFDHPEHRRFGKSTIGFSSAV